MTLTLIYVTDPIFIEPRMKPSVTQQVWRHTKFCSAKWDEANAGTRQEVFHAPANIKSVNVGVFSLFFQGHTVSKIEH
jgi:hypothetical protein